MALGDLWNRREERARESSHVEMTVPPAALRALMARAPSPRVRSSILTMPGPERTFG